MTAHTWLIAAAIFVFLEILPPASHFFWLCLAFGALGAAISMTFTPLVWVPWAVFGVVSIGLTPLMIPLAKFLFSTKSHASNVDALIGQRALVTETILPNTAGMVKIHGEQWRATTSELDPILKDQWAQILRVEGTHVIVTASPT